jgi:hypothetical protein
MNVDVGNQSRTSGGIERPARRSRSFFAIGALLLVIAASVAHLELLGRRLDYNGFLLPLDHLFTVFVAAGLFLLCIAVGRRMLRRIAITIEDPTEGIPVAAAIGAALTGTVLLVAGTAGLLRPWGLALIIIAIALVSRSEWGNVRLWFARLPAALRVHGFSSAGLALLAVLLIFPLLVALAPPLDWDSLMYHLDVPSSYLAAGRTYLPVDNLHAVLVGPIQLLYIPLLALAAPSAPAVLNVLFLASLPLAMVATASRFLSSRCGPLAATAVLGNTALVLVAATPRIDATLCVFTFLGHSALLSAREQSDGWRYYLLSAVLLGAAVGVKLHALAYVLALFPLICWIAIAQRWSEADPRLAGRTKNLNAPMLIGMFALVGGLASLPWLVRSQWMVGAPFYPLLASPRTPPWLADLFGASGIPASVDAYVYNWIGPLRSRFNLLDAFVAPHRLTIEPEGYLYFFSPFLLLTLLWLLKPRPAAVNWLAWGGGAYLLIVLLPFPQTNLRYLLPAVVPLSLVAAHGLVHVSTWLPAARAVQRVLVIVALAPTVLAAYVLGSATPVGGHALGVRSETEYLNGHPVQSVIGMRTLLQQIPKDGRTLFLFEARGYGVNRDVLQDNMGLNWPLLVASGANVRCLAGMGITHVLVNHEVVTYYASRGLDVNRLQWSMFDHFAKECLEEIEHTRSFYLYRVRR